VASHTSNERGKGGGYYFLKQTLLPFGSCLAEKIFTLEMCSSSTFQVDRQEEVVYFSFLKKFILFKCELKSNLVQKPTLATVTLGGTG
jgi:hypothetical protein